MGELYYPDGKMKYQGELMDGEPHGHGVGYWNDGETVWFIGSFRKGKPEGMGKFYYPDGQLRYEGEFDRDLQYCGQGTEYYKNGNIRFTGIYRKCFYFFYGARRYVEGNLYYENGTLRYVGTFGGDKNYEFREGLEYDEEGRVKKVWKDAN